MPRGPLVVSCAPSFAKESTRVLVWHGSDPPAIGSLQGDGTVSRSGPTGHRQILSGSQKSTAEMRGSSEGAGHDRADESSGVVAAGLMENRRPRAVLSGCFAIGPKLLVLEVPNVVSAIRAP